MLCYVCVFVCARLYLHVRVCVFAFNSINLTWRAKNDGSKVHKH